MPLGLELPTVLEALRANGVNVRHAAGGTVMDSTDEDIAAAVDVVANSDICVAVLGDQAGLFGRGTSGEGCDAADLRLPGRQDALLRALVDTGKPVVLVLLVGRPYELSEHIDKLSAVLCGFFPGEEGGPAIAAVLDGSVNPTGRLPISFPRAGASQPATYLAARLALLSEVSSVDPTPLFGFGHGLSYAPVAWDRIEAIHPEQWATDGTAVVEVTVRNPHDRPTADVVQIYLHDVASEVVRPEIQLIAAARIELMANTARLVRFSLHADLTSFTGIAGRRIVDPGEVQLRVAASSTDVRKALRLNLIGARRYLGVDRVLEPDIDIVDVDIPDAGETTGATTAGVRTAGQE